MGAASRRRKQFAIGNRHLSKICGKSIKGGRPMYKAVASGSVAQAIERERIFAARQQAMKKKKK